MKKLLLFTILAAALLTTCSEPIDFLAEVETEVKLANNLYLIVESVSPALDLTNVNPQDTLKVRFDRPINLSTITDSTVALTDGVGRYPCAIEDYDSENNILTLCPSAPLKILTRYSAKLEGIKGRDGSELQRSYTWYFTTGNFPGGTASVASKNSLSLPGYTDSQNIEVTVTVNDAAASLTYYISENADFSSNINSTLSALGSSMEDFTLSSGDGWKTVYVRIACEIGGSWVNGETIEFDIFLDTSPPTVNNVLLASGASMSTSQIVNLTYDVTESPSASNPLRYQHDTSDFDSNSFGQLSSASVDTSVSFSAANYVEKEVTVRVLDRAGNEDTGTDTIYIDTIPVSIPNVNFSDNTPTSGTTTLDPTPRWYWSSNGGGNGNYRYSWNNSTWTNVASSTSYTPSVSDGTHTLYVQEQDPNGSWSSSGSQFVRVSPVIPYSGQTKVSRTPTLYWRPVALADEYAVQGYDPVHGWTTVASGLKSPTYTFSGTLPSGTLIQWRFGYKQSRDILYNYSPTYGFTTTTFRF